MTVVWCDGIVPLAAGVPSLAVWGTVSEDHKTITFACGQKPGLNNGNGDLVLCEWEERGGGLIVSTAGSIVFTKQADGSFTTDNPIGFVDDEYVYQGGLVLPGSVWTK